MVCKDVVKSMVHTVKPFDVNIPSGPYFFKMWETYLLTYLSQFSHM